MPNHGFILNPAGYVQALIDTFTQAGGTFVQAEVKDFDISGGQITGVETDQGRFDCERAVLSAGIWSRPLMDKLASMSRWRPNAAITSSSNPPTTHPIAP